MKQNVTVSVYNVVIRKSMNSYEPGKLKVAYTPTKRVMG